MAAGWILKRRLTPLELVAAITLISLLVWIFIGRARALMASAEREMLIAAVANLRTALNVTALARVVRRDWAGLAALDGANPMAVAAHVPRGYLGERSDAVAAQLEPGSWYFDPERRLLVYRVSHPERFSSGLPGPRRARFRVELRYRDDNRNRRFDPPGEPFEGITLRAAEPYRWAGESGWRR